MTDRQKLMHIIPIVTKAAIFGFNARAGKTEKMQTSKKAASDNKEGKDFSRTAAMWVTKARVTRVNIHAVSPVTIPPITRPTPVDRHIEQDQAQNFLYYKI